MAPRSRNEKAEKKFSVDALMRNVASTLVSDFQVNLSDPCFCSDYQRELSVGSVARIRELSPAPTNEMDVARYKATYQIQSVMKRYRHHVDVYSDQELIDKAILGFRETQNRLAAVNLDDLSCNEQVVLDLAADYIAKVLGVYDDEECRTLCRFGKKASVGIPAAQACEAARWELPISGSPEQISWFDSEMSQVDSVQKYWLDQLESDPQRSIYQETSSLTLSLVPKTFKSLRAIMPNTTIGSYMSFGIGEIIRKRLRREGYDIRTLQMRHRHLACQASLHGLHVTADLSSASDSITVALVKRLFPPDWFEILNRSRIGSVRLPDGSETESVTFCTMGIGYTFPLQTLVFLALLKAVQATLYDRFDRRTISVYGDDMIYSTRMHNEVVHNFEKFGFVVNVEKTFATGSFRESCGGDYYHGVDVRPFQPRSGSAMVGKLAYEAILYKYVNGLLARWSEYEIGNTLNFLLTQIEMVSGKVKRVPGEFPDDAGVKCPTLTTWVFLRRAKCASLKYLGHGVYRFPYLRHVPKERKEVRHDPYLWLRLRGERVPIDYSIGFANQGHPCFTQQLISLTVGIKDGSSPLIERDDIPIQFVRTLCGKRLRRKACFVTISHSGKYTRQSGTSCFEDRR